MFRLFARSFRRGVQDGPPPGGFPPVDPRRKLPARGPGNVVTLLGTAAIVTWGWSRIADTNLHQREVQTEKRQARLAITPYLEHEDDIRQCYYLDGTAAVEREAMKGVAGWEAGKSVYHGNRYVPPVAPIF